MPVTDNSIENTIKSSSETQIETPIKTPIETPIEITIEELADLPRGTYVLYDVRDRVSYEYDSIPDAESCPEDELYEKATVGSLPKEKLVLFCMHGTVSYSAAATLQKMGIDAVSLKGGMGAWLKKNTMPEDRSKEIERNLMTNKRFHKNLFSRFAKAIRDYELLQPGDKVAVCISGGKDSMLMAKLFQELKRHDRFPFELEFIVMDPGYNDLNRTLIENNAASLGVPITVFESTIFDVVDTVTDSPCYLCARMRRGHLYKKAQEMGCNKIALGHHYDDVIETILMGMLWGGQMQTMMPKLHSTNFEGMELIRPMYLIREDDIKAWRDANDLHFIQCACHFTDTCSSCRDDGSPVSKRMETKQLIKKLKETNPYVENNIFRSVENVNLATVIAYKQNGIKHSFLDEYDD